MKSRLMYLLLVAVAALAAPALAQEGEDPGIEDLEVTIRLLPRDAGRPDIITRTIVLPPQAKPEAAEDDDDKPALPGDRPGNAQEGLEVAEDARERGREFGQDMAEQARENREDASRGGPPDDVPGPPGDPPGPP